MSHAPGLVNPSQQSTTPHHSSSDNTLYRIALKVVQPLVATQGTSADDVSFAPRDHLDLLINPNAEPNSNNSEGTAPTNQHNEIYTAVKTRSFFRITPTNNPVFWQHLSDAYSLFATQLCVVVDKQDRGAEYWVVVGYDVEVVLPPNDEGEGDKIVFEFHPVGSKRVRF